MSGKSTTALFEEGRSRLKELQTLMEGRRNRDRACMRLTDLWLCFNEIAKRLEETGSQFEARATTVDEDADAEDGGREEVTMWELMASAPTAEEEAVSVSTEQQVSELRLHYYRLFLDYMVHGCSSPEETVKNLLAIARRVRPEALGKLGLTQSDVARRLGERRATVQAREKRVVERPLRAAGVKGFHLLGGTKSEGHREACREAQMGNKNRANGEARKRRA